MVKVAVSGACGRMGRRLGSMIAEDNELELICALECSDHADLGKDFGELIGLGPTNVKVSEEISALPDVLIDFSAPEGTSHWVDVCYKHKVAMVIGTTGLTDRTSEQISSASRDIAIMQAPNMSVGVNVLFRLVGEMAKSLGDDYDVEIVETHHRYKKDAPSGTALALLKAVCEGLGCDPRRVAIFGRQGPDAARAKGQIGVHAVRLGGCVGEHTVYFGAPGETVSISHTAHSRDTFAQGALRAAKWVVGRRPGLYSMQDVLFEDS